MPNPAAQLLFTNNATTTLASAITSGATTIQLAPGTGALFPSPGTGQYFAATLTDAATGQLHEVVWATAVATDTVTVVRAQEGTAALAWNAGDFFANLLTSGDLAQFRQRNYSRQALITGFNIALGNAQIENLFIDPAGTLATGTVTLPAAPSDAQRVRFSTTQTITTLTVSAGGAQTVMNAPTTLAAGAGIGYIYDAANTTWYRE
jgi:hypothetical protein